MLDANYRSSAKNSPSTPSSRAPQRRSAVCALLLAGDAASIGRAPLVARPSTLWRLLSGPPGTGKTRIVRQASKDFGVPLVALAADRLASGGEESGERLRAPLSARRLYPPCERVQC